MTLKGRALLAERCKALGIPLSRLARESRHAHAYFHQYVKQGSPRKLSEETREVIAPILGVSPDDLREPDDPRAWLPTKGNRQSKTTIDPELMATTIALVLRHLNVKAKQEPDEIGRLCVALYGLALGRKNQGKRGKLVFPTVTDVEKLIRGPR